ncbi:dTMP kinase [Nonomuraea solani]|uniref:dTMP kinase n=1 Tax=Nonomuraea solani TaxID=1144553 RepID=A0A1H6EV32_9ACTN|nr:AAA family ATPase [Nonomuraea solani]SEH01770.1 dTMP kinase [Nonomuraea solani]
MIIGLEGVSCTGKSTLASALAARLGRTCVVPCYYHAAPDPSLLPAPLAASEAEQHDALAQHLQIEQLRARHVRAAVGRGAHVVLDRTVDTLLAHLRAVGAIRTLDANASARILVEQHIVQGLAVVPEVTLLLQAGHEVLAARAKGRPGMPPLYYDAVFADGFHAHFRAPITPICLSLDAASPADQVLEHACGLLKPYLEGLR